MKYKSMFPWMILDILVFITVNVLLIKYLVPIEDIFSTLTFFKLVVLGLAVYRGANIVSNEFISTPLRAPFVYTVMRDSKEVEEPYDQGLRGFFGSLLYCPSCTGVWISLVLVYSYLLWPGPASVVVLLLALSGLERFFAYSFGKIKR